MEPKSKKTDQIVKELKEAHQESLEKNKEGYQPEKDTLASDLSSQIKGSDADIDKAINPMNDSGKSITEQRKGSDADQD